VPDQLLASGALPPAFGGASTAIRTVWRHYSNTQIEAVLDDKRSKEAVIFACRWESDGPEPETL